MPAMSQGRGSEWVVVPIAKFSHNSCPVGTRNFVWNHVSLREDMDIVFQSSRIADDCGTFQNRVVMKVTAGAELLVCAKRYGSITRLTWLAGSTRPRRFGQNMSWSHWYIFWIRTPCTDCYQKSIPGNAIPASNSKQCKLKSSPQARSKNLVKIE